LGVTVLAYLMNQKYCKLFFFVHDLKQVDIVHSWVPCHLWWVSSYLTWASLH